MGLCQEAVSYHLVSVRCLLHPDMNISYSKRFALRNALMCVSCQPAQRIFHLEMLEHLSLRFAGILMVADLMVHLRLAAPSSLGSLPSKSQQGSTCCPGRSCLPRAKTFACGLGPNSKVLLAFRQAQSSL